MPTVTLPSTLARLASGLRELQLEGATAGELLRRLEETHPRIRGWVLDEQGRLRPHVHVFINDEQGSLTSAVAPEDRIHVLQAISGGAPEAEGEDGDVELLVGSKKGLFVLRGPRGGAMKVAARHFPGQVVEYAARDPRTGRTFASVTHGQFGPHLYFTEDPAVDPDGEWREAEGPVFPEDTGATVHRTWVVEPGVEDGELWAGVAPAALFRSSDGGESWELVRSLWDHPSRPRWEGGLGGLCLHSICPWPGRPDRLALAISAAGVWITDDGAVSWRRGGKGLVPRYLPEEARAEAVNLCVHKMERSPVVPERLYCQFHGGVYRSDDEGATWTELSSDGRLPADFGFPIVIDPRDPERVWVIPLKSAEDRVPPDGRLRVYETRDAGASWQPCDRGLPQEGAFVNVLRQSFCHDGRDPLGLYFGTRTGEVFASADGGGSWVTAARHLASITSVRTGG